MSLFTPEAPPATKLGHYRQLAPRAAIHVSPIALGAMSIGDKWANLGMGAMDKEASFKLLDAFFDAGGNHIDTANNYQDGSSEEFIGEWMEARGNRDQLVIATKKNLYMGNNTKSLKLSVENSLARLRTSYIDILYVHYWDLHTEVEEMMDSLHNFVVAGKVIYLGISDTPVWFVVKANEFVVYQAAYSVTERDIEREIMPMCRHEGIALTLWNVLAAGHIRTDAEEEARRQTGENGWQVMGPWERTADEKMCAALEVVADQVGTKHITAVAIAYTMHKAPFVFPIIGGRKVEHLLANIEALSIKLTADQMKYIDAVLPFDFGFPGKCLGELGGPYPFMMSIYAKYDVQPLPPPITPSDS
ncbi:aryl-alcohol dehydrogenase [Mycena rebaudengoi]|nr:aryl-alcohol dehydrogenase [Mycena rebaudengoi]